jgi:glycerol-3-phosphate dehydrogenase (NAD+)
MAGTLKNLVAVGAGFIDGLGYGQNTKAAILREGLAEMRELAKEMYPTVRDDTFMESCGMADLIATCYGGRNRKVAAEWAKANAKVNTSYHNFETRLSRQTPDITRDTQARYAIVQECSIWMIVSLKVGG